MSRETDRSSSGPQGRGGSPYPPGSGPYGPGATGDSADSEERESDAQRRSEDRKTETTLTTRIRINIPGSRPIPPVVMRTPVSESESGGAGGKTDGGAGTASGADRNGRQGPNAPSPADGAHPLRAPGDGGAPGVRPGGSGGGAAGGPGPGAPGSARGSEETSGGGEFKQETSDWFAPRKSKPAAGGGPGAGGPGTGPSGPSGPGSASGPGAGGPRPGGPADSGTPGAAGSPYGGSGPYGLQDPYGVGDSYGSSDPYDTGSHPLARTDTPPGGTPVAGGPAAPPLGPDGGQSQDRPTTGPVSGDMPLPPPPGQGTEPPESPASSTLGLGVGRAPFAPGGAGEEMLSRETGGLDGLPSYGVSQGSGGAAVADDPEEDRVVSDTLMSRAPRLADDESSGTGGSPFERASSPAADRDDSAGRRSKLMLAGAGLLGVVGLVYGAGLLFDHADVPNGTTVLGVDIGGMSRHEAVNKLDAAFGERTTQAFTVVADDQRAKLKPSVAGMTLDTEATVGRAAGRDYNPVTVIGSLFGAPREAEPALKVDEEKMASALSQVSKETGVGGTAKDGMVKFVDGKAVAVPGKAHKGIDTDKASGKLEDAYRRRAATGNNSPVELPVSRQQPKVGKKEIARAIRDFGKPAMSGLVTIKAGNASIQFSPEKSLPKFLSMKPVNGTLVDTYDLPVLKQLYGTTFDGVRITRGDGSKTPVTPQDVAGALRLALKETSPSKRVQEIPLNAQ